MKHTSWQSKINAVSNTNRVLFFRGPQHSLCFLSSLFFFVHSQKKRKNGTHLPIGFWWEPQRIRFFNIKSPMVSYRPKSIMSIPTRSTSRHPVDFFFFFHFSRWLLFFLGIVCFMRRWFCATPEKYSPSLLPFLPSHPFSRPQFCCSLAKQKICNIYWKKTQPQKIKKPWGNGWLDTEANGIG